MKLNQHIFKKLGKFQYELDTTNIDPIFIKVIDISSGISASTIYNCEYEPLFGEYDPIDIDNVNNKINVLIKYLSPDKQLVIEEMENIISQIKNNGITWLDKLNIRALEFAVETLRKDEVNENEGSI